MFQKLKKISENIEQFSSIQNDELDFAKIEELYTEYDNICLDIISDRRTPQSVSDYILKDIDNEISKEYYILKEMTTLKENVRNILKNKLLERLQNNDFEKISQLLLFALRIDIKNIVLFDYIENLFREYELYKELIELYRTAFIVTTNPDYFIKIGDIQAIKEDYNSAIDSYLSYAELNGATVDIYKKLEKMFEKINDEDSRLACIQQIKSLEV